MSTIVNNAEVTPSPSDSKPNEETALIIPKSGDPEEDGDVETEEKKPTREAGFVWLVIFVFFVVAALVVTSLALAGTFAGPDDDDDGDIEGDNDIIVADPVLSSDNVDEIPFECSLEAITTRGSAIACHDPTGCQGPNDSTEWCYVSDVEVPFNWAVEHQDEFEGLNRTTDKLAIAGEILSHLKPTCQVNACQHRICNCRDNGNGTSHCFGREHEEFPFVDTLEGNYFNCLPAKDQEAEFHEQHMFMGKPTACACLDTLGCGKYNGETPSWIIRNNHNITISDAARCYVSIHHEGSLDHCVPEACGMIFPCTCEEHDNGTSSCPTTLPFRDVEVVPNCENFEVP
eukprot:591401-Prorocentrum_minimum.AAC.1